MSVRPLRLEPDRVLRAQARPVTEYGGALRTLIRDLMDTMYAHDGIGLAAPQVGCDWQVFVANPSQQRGREVVLVNPVLERHAGRASILEGCLSVPEVWGKVGRAASVRLSGRDAGGRPVVVEADGLLAIVLQHEYDHLQGTIFIDRLSWISRQRARVRVQRRVRAAAAR